MKHIYLFFVIIILFSACSKKTGIEVLLQTQERIEKLKTVEYKITYKAEYKQADIRIDTKGNSFLDLDHQDSLLNTRYHFIYNETPLNSEQVFNGSQLFEINWIDSTLKSLKIKKEEKYKKTISSSFFMSSSYVFLKEALFQLFENNLISNDNCKLSNVNINDKQYYKIEIVLMNYGFWYTELIKNEEPEFFTKLDIVIDKTDFLPRKIGISDSKESYFSISNISEIKVNSEYPDSIWNINKFPAELRRIDPNKQNPLLPIGAIAPDWNLPTLEMDSLSLNSLKGNLVLLNFWSINCHGCIKSIPSLNLLHQKYASAGFKVVGVTSNEKSPIKIESIVQKFDIKFPILWKGETIEKMYQTWAHPTFYLLDKNGKIIYSMTGYSENEFNKMEKIIIKYYKKL